MNLRLDLPVAENGNKPALCRSVKHIALVSVASGTGFGELILSMYNIIEVANVTFELYQM
jgi:hypothetical protein